MFAFPPEFPFVSGRKAEQKPAPAAVSPEPQPEPIRPTVDAETRLPQPPPAATASNAERRKLKRDAIATAALLRVDGFHGPATRIELMDISVAGARFRSPKPLEIGEKAQIRVEIGPFRWTTRLRIVHSTPLESGFTSIGCAFQRTELLRPWPAAA